MCSSRPYPFTGVVSVQRHNAEVDLVQTIRRWQSEVLDLLPERIKDLHAIVRAGLNQPEPTRRRGRQAGKSGPGRAS